MSKPEQRIKFYALQWVGTLKNWKVISKAHLIKDFALAYDIFSEHFDHNYYIQKLHLNFFLLNLCGSPTKQICSEKAKILFGVKNEKFQKPYTI